MAQQIQKKFIKDNAVDGEKILLGEGQDLRRVVGGLEVNVIADLDGKIISESTARTNADSALQTELDGTQVDLANEISRATTAEGALQTELDATQVDLANEITRATNAESALQTELDGTQVDLANEISRAMTKENSLQAEIDAEELARANADTNLQANIDLKINLSEKGVANGVATLDASGLVPANQLPSYVDDVIEVADLAALNALAVKEQGKIYVTLDTNKTYRWSGTTFVYITSGAVDSVNTKTGLVVLDASDVKMLDGVTSIESKLNSLQSEVDADESALALLKATPENQILYVAKNGSDATGTGSQFQPFLTIAAAQASVSDASDLKRYVISIGAGSFVESVGFELKTHFSYLHEGTRGSCSVSVASGNIVWNVDSSANPKVNLQNISIFSPIDVNHASATNTAVLEAWHLFATGLISMINSGAAQLQYQMKYSRLGAINTSGNVGGFVEFSTHSGINHGSGTPTNPQGFLFRRNSATTGVGNTVAVNAASYYAYNSYTDTTYVDARGLGSRDFIYTSDSIRGTGLTVVGTVNQIKLSDIRNSVYVPAVVGDWSVAPSDPKSALDELASRVKAVETDAGEFAEIKITVTAQHLTDGYVDLNHDAIQSSLVAHVSRLAIFINDDYLLSVVAGKTRVTFTGDLIAPSQEALAVGDVLRFKYKY